MLSNWNFIGGGEPVNDFNQEETWSYLYFGKLTLMVVLGVDKLRKISRRC